MVGDDRGATIIGFVANGWRNAWRSAAALLSIVTEWTSLCAWMQGDEHVQERRGCNHNFMMVAWEGYCEIRAGTRDGTEKATVVTRESQKGPASTSVIGMCEAHCICRFAASKARMYSAQVAQSAG
jgi:hypothetical protein